MKLKLWLILLALLIGGALSAGLSYWATEKYSASLRADDPLQKAGELNPSQAQRGQ